ncbi:iron-containing alcohol dehydrogenase [Halieaceae bacterium IMCC14734]|uniref:Iron-containing alcohol dehydrogenase n=1 Tax=Candidatus Litorirhabdus singularis TaxID=2518993 RepID=A0ABT3THS3_9GAMM|nr:iron-containing alcohol dehydrogenase [Candidatus Litorirhabdus singularis]MCX2981881.1 iron-containing alcohol dehydrogenase [Candidatus Litorirhabdus singularis]
MKAFTFNTTKSIISEPGALQRIGAICASLNITRPLIISDAGIVKIGLLAQLEAALSDADLPLLAFTDVVADPPESVVEQALQLALTESVDGVIGFGGGSSMDTAKLVALLARSGESLADVYGVDQAQGQRLPLVLVPTTAGTGSEVTAVAIVTTGETTKAGVVANQLLPDVALLDAQLTLGLPAPITAATGIDAMVHAIEAYTSAHKKNPYSDMLARQALTLLADNIREATHQGDSVDARQAMLLGACLAGQAFANAPVAAVHALAYPLGGHFHIPHGLSNSLVLPHVLRFNAESDVASAQYAELANHLLPEQCCGDDHKDSAALINWLQTLIADLQLPASLEAMNIEASALPVLAADAMLQQRLLINNPRVVEEADALAIYQAAWKD